MAREFRRTPVRRLANVAVSMFTRLGVGDATWHLLSVRGRRSGRIYTNPVSVIDLDGRRWLVAPYGPTGWVPNARAAGEVTLRRGRRSETVRVREAAPEEAGPVLREYVRRIGRIVHPYFDARPDDPPEAFAAEAARHPVFRLERPDN